MPIASLTQIEKTFGQRVLFDKLDFAIDRGERVGLIGDNGSGKSTLFKMFIREMVPDSGSVSIAKSVKVGHLAQDPVFEPGNTVIDEAELAYARLHELSHLMRDLEHEMAVAVDEALEKVLNKYQDAQHEFDLAGGYVWRHKLEATLLGVGLMADTWEQQVSTLSGGQRSRLALAKLLISEPDVLLLDEPTNHLDLAAISWLETYLRDFSGAVLLISHDRYLLDRLATRVVWLTQSKLRNYPGNYSSFVEQRTLQELSQQRAYEQQHADIEKQKEFIRRFGAGQRAREAKGREKRLDRLLKSDAVIQEVTDAKAIALSINTDQRAGDKVLTVRELSKAYDSKVLWNEIGFEIKRGERIGIIGPNGSGKTTLLEVLLGKRTPDGGSLRWGANLSIGYYDQRLDEFDPENTVTEEVRGERVVKDQDLRNILALMLFRGHDVDKKVGMLSGGERARVAMAQLLLDKPNVLVLDEPTNHLDIASCEALEGAMDAFDGTILCVSHDRFFLDKVVRRMLVLRPPGLVDFDGNFSAYATKLASDGAKSVAKTAKNSKPAKATAPAPAQVAKPLAKRSDAPWSRPFGKLSTQELERGITETEIALAQCQSQFGQTGNFKDAKKATRVQTDFETLTKKLQGLEEEYFSRGQK